LKKWQQGGATPRRIEMATTSEKAMPPYVVLLYIDKTCMGEVLHPFPTLPFSSRSASSLLFGLTRMANWMELGWKEVLAKPHAEPIHQKV